MPRRRIGSLSASTQRSFLRASRRSPSRSMYTQVRSSTAVIRTFVPSRMAMKPSIRTSSSSSSTSLRRREPGGRGFVDGTSGVRRAPGNPGLMLSRDDPGPGSGGLGLGGDGGVRAGFFAARLADAGAGRPLESRPVARAWPDARLEELTPELPDPAHRVRDGPESHHRSGPRRGLHDRCVLGLGDAFRMDPDHAQVNAAFQHHERPYPSVTLEPSRVRDLEPASGDDVPAHQAGDRHLRALDIRLYVGLRADEEVAVAVDLAAEPAQDLAAALDLQAARQYVVTRQHGRLRLAAFGRFAAPIGRGRPQRL